MNTSAHPVTLVTHPIQNRGQASTTYKLLETPDGLIEIAVLPLNGDVASAMLEAVNDSGYKRAYLSGDDIPVHGKQLASKPRSYMTASGKLRTLIPRLPTHLRLPLGTIFNANASREHWQYRFLSVLDVLERKGFI